MIYKTTNDAGQLTIQLKGNLTFSDYAIFNQILDLIKKNKDKKCIFDIQQLTNIDSAGLGMLILCKEQLEDSSHNISIINANGHVGKMLQLGKFNEIFEIQFIND
jgi:anti-anti-sigma factor